VARVSVCERSTSAVSTAVGTSGDALVTAVVRTRVTRRLGSACSAICSDGSDLWVAVSDAPEVTTAPPETCTVPSRGSLSSSDSDGDADEPVCPPVSAAAAGSVEDVESEWAEESVDVEVESVSATATPALAATAMPKPRVNASAPVRDTSLVVFVACSSAMGAAPRMSGAPRPWRWSYRCGLPRQCPSVAPLP
jgi:hypothetical protein